MVTREKLPEGRNRLIGKVALVIGGGSIASAASWRVSTSSQPRSSSMAASQQPVGV